MALLSLALPAGAAAQTGGAAMPDDPEIAQAVCEDAAAWECARGAELTLQGEALADVRRVRFLGRRGKADDRVVRPRRAEENQVVVVVPRKARTGPIAVRSAGGARARSPQRLRVKTRVVLRAALEPGGGVFPIVGRRHYGTHTNTFGGGRGHEGQDVFARCGAPLLAVYDARVQHVAFHSRAGHYIVIQTPDRQSYAYMHLQSAPTHRRGDRVVAGERIGRVGDTGRASGCHLHFEQWTAPGWYEGGKPVDPLPLLRSLESQAR